jgi:hypothetical protein
MIRPGSAETNHEGYICKPTGQDLNNFAKLLGTASSTEKNSSIGSAHAAFRYGHSIVARSYRIEVVILEGLLVFRILHEFRNRVLLAVSTKDRSISNTNTYTSHELEDRNLGFLKQFGDLFQTLDHCSVLSNGFGHSSS